MVTFPHLLRCYVLLPMFPPARQTIAWVLPVVGSPRMRVIAFALRHYAYWGDNRLAERFHVPLATAGGAAQRSACS
jgi:hypothetical protein